MPQAYLRPWVASPAAVGHDDEFWPCCAAHDSGRARHEEGRADRGSELAVEARERVHHTPPVRRFGHPQDRPVGEARADLAGASAEQVLALRRKAHAAVTGAPVPVGGILRRHGART